MPQIKQRVRRAWQSLLHGELHDDSHLYGGRKYADGLLARVAGAALMGLLLLALWRLLWWML